MIIWLASYPRSGNTLARTLIFNTLGLRSADLYELQSLTALGPEGSTVDYGAWSLNQQLSWSAAYRHMTASSHPFLVKTHSAPIDGQPVIHVIRDGRKACVSYLEYHLALLPDEGRTLEQIVRGDDAFGHWSDHYRTWTSASVGRTHLVVRYEDLLEGSTDLVGRLASFIGYEGAILAWQNPFADLQARHPSVFRQGRAKWEGDPRWTADIEALFDSIHGPLMRDLGYF